ncbi:hypothetical protein HU200_053434 [Digitaria exilis]|uniref:Disease resistance R13L4/SHOC-2-like LRR domain-containing protein n=1 Tax=Digitaria exilis TaxID=1010633 RepID=A0A835E6F9_9POAL|nr:hypothetical protein HU200_053434 [Digitaria exilis]
MEYSPVGLYHDIVLRLTRKKVNEQDNKHSSQIFHGILDQCNPHEFCMKMFAHALYTNPKRSKEELRKLHSTLRAVYPRSFGQGCQCFGVKYKRYLKDICCKIKLLKYLSLRRTNVIQLPIEINNLHELEVLDIRQTEVPPFATRNVHLLKLKRLLAGHTDPSPSSIYPSTTIIVKEFPRSVDIPEKVETMEAMEVLSCVKAQTSQDLKDIGKLWQLRKLGVVIKDKDTHLSSLLKTIDDLHECLQSLSITLLNAGLKGIPSSGGLPDAIRPPKVESLSISGITHKVNLLQLLADGNNQLTKGSNITDISFDNGATPELEKITLSFIDDVKSLSGVEDLPRLKEIELNTNTTTGTTSRNNEDKNSSSGRSSATTTTTTTTTTNSNNEDIDNSTSARPPLSPPATTLTGARSPDNHRNKPVIKKNEPENQEKAIENSPARKEDECFQFCWKNQV